MLCSDNFDMLRRSMRLVSATSLPVRQRSRRGAGSNGRASADVTAALEQVDATRVTLPRVADKVIFSLSARRAVVQSGGERQGRLTRLYSASAGGVLMSFLEGGAVAHSRTRVADILPSLCDGGVVVALGVLHAASSTAAVTAATRLLVALTLSQTGNLAAMKRLNMYDVLAHVLRSKAMAGLVDKSTLLLLFAMAGMRDVAVVVESTAHEAASRHSNTRRGRRRLSEIVHEAVQVAERIETGYAHGAGEIMSNPLVCRHVLLNFDIWVHTSDECLATLLRSLHQSVEYVRDAHARINRDVLRSVGVVRHLLSLLMRVNLAGEVVSEVTDLLQVRARGRVVLKRCVLVRRVEWRWWWWWCGRPGLLFSTTLPLMLPRAVVPCPTGAAAGQHAQLRGLPGHHHVPH